MDLQEFAAQRPYLYHLTDQKNLGNILKNRQLLSTTAIAKLTLNGKELKDFLSKKREGHSTIINDGVEYQIRDQKPISIAVLDRSLSDGLTSADFIELLNNRVFWWPTPQRLDRHFVRYSEEKPVIIRVETSTMLELNKNVEFCHLNSGATRCHPSYNGNAPTRGLSTFLTAALYTRTIPTVAEVTFIGRCNLPETAWISHSPRGPWQLT